jgi:hypothetical protein
MNLPFFIYQIGLLAIISLFFLKKGGFFIISALFFTALFFIEYICYKKITNGLSTNKIYNWWFPIEFIFYAFFLIKGDNKNKHFKITIILSLIYLAFVLVFYSFFQNQKLFSSISYQIGEIYLLFLITLRIRSILKEEYLGNPFKNSLVWLIMGLLFSNLGSLMHLSVTNYLAIQDIDLLNALRKLNIILTIVLYCCITVYFYFEWKNRKSHI